MLDATVWGEKRAILKQTKEEGGANEKNKKCSHSWETRNGMERSYVTYTVWNQHGSKGIHHQYQTTADNRRVKNCNLKTNKSYPLYITVLHIIKTNLCKVTSQVIFKKRVCSFFVNTILNLDLIAFTVKYIIILLHSKILCKYFLRL